MVYSGARKKQLGDMSAFPCAVTPSFLEGRYGGEEDGEDSGNREVFEDLILFLPGHHPQDGASFTKVLKKSANLEIFVSLSTRKCT